MSKHGPLQKETKAKSKQWIWNFWELMRKKEKMKQLEIKCWEKLNSKLISKSKLETVTTAM